MKNSTIISEVLLNFCRLIFVKMKLNWNIIENKNKNRYLRFYSYIWTIPFNIENIKEYRV